MLKFLNRKSKIAVRAEIYEDMSTKSVIHKQVEVVTCTKHNATATVIGCKASTPSTDPIFVGTSCSEDTEITHPTEQNTVNKGASFHPTSTDPMRSDFIIVMA